MRPLSERFRGFLPVVIDVETGGFNAGTDAILEIAASLLRMDDEGTLNIHASHAYNVIPFEGANLEQSALDFTGIDPYHPFREAVTEDEAFGELFKIVRKEMKEQGCVRAILVGRSAHFDAGFFNAAVERCGRSRVWLRSGPNTTPSSTRTQTASRSGFASSPTRGSPAPKTRRR